MQSQSKITESYQELLNSLIQIHPDFDLKLTQPQYENNLDILKAAYLSVTLKTLNSDENSQPNLKSIDQVKKKELLQAKLTLLTGLKERKMREQETSDEEIDGFITFNEKQIQRYKDNPGKLPGLIETQKELKFIKSVSYALQSTLQNINNQAEEEVAQAQANEEQKDMNDKAALIKQWDAIHDPFADIADIDAEVNDIRRSIERFRLRNQTIRMQEEEEKLALILRIIKADERITPRNKSDQEVLARLKEELARLKEELELNDLEAANEALAFEEGRRGRYQNNITLLTRADLQIEKIQRFIQILEELSRHSSDPIPDPIPDPKIIDELHRLCHDEEIKSQEQAEDDLLFEKQQLERISNNQALPRYQRTLKKVNNLERIIELYRIIGRKIGQSDTHPPEDMHPLPIPYPPTDTIVIPEADPITSYKDSAILRAEYAMGIEKNLPECFQMSMNKVIYLSTFLLYGKSDELLGELTEIQMQQQLALNLGSLLFHYENEGFENLEVRKLINEVKNCGHSTNDLEKIIKNIYSAQIKHRFFNFKDFKRLLSLNEQSAMKIIGLDITLLLGSTGCGKSTTVHYLCGSEMNQTKHGKLIHIQPSRVINEDLKKVKCSPLAKSETRYVAPININLAKLGQQKEQIITLVDSPGSQDTESYEVDISNGLGILRAVRQASGVRIAILFSYLRLGARGEEIKKLIAFYAGMLKNLNNHLQAFTFFFTHVPQNVTISNLRAILQDGFSLLTEQEKQNKNLVTLFEDIVQKAQDAEDGTGQRVHILRPLDRKAIELHHSILQSKPITEISAFLERIDEKGKFQVLQQFRLHSTAIVAAIKRNDGKYAKDLLEDLIYFQQVFPQDQVFKNHIKSIVGEVISYGQQLFNQGMQSFYKAFKVQEDSNLTIEDFQKFKLCFLQAKEAIDPFCIIIKTTFLKDKNSSNDKLQSFQYLQYLREMIEESLDHITRNSNDLANPLWNRFQNKYLLTLKFFQDPPMREEGFIKFLEDNIICYLDKAFQDAVSELLDKTKQLIVNLNLINFALSANDDNNKSVIELITENLTQLAAASNLTDDEIWTKTLKKSIEEILDSIKKRYSLIRHSELKDIIQFVDHLRISEQQNLQEEQKQEEEEVFFEVTPKHIENMTNFFQMHQQLSSKLALISGIDQKIQLELENEVSDLKDQLLKFYNGNEDKLKLVIKKRGTRHRNIHKVYKQIKSLRKVPFIYNESGKGFDEVIALLETLVESQKEIVTKLIPEFDQMFSVKGSKFGSPLSQLKESLMMMMDLEDLFPQNNIFFNDIKEQLRIKLETLADKLKSQANDLYVSISLEEIKIIKQLDEIYQQLNDIEQIAKIIGQKIQNIELGTIQKSIRDILDSIEGKKNGEETKALDIKPISRSDCAKKEQTLLFLKAICQESSPLLKQLGFLKESKIIYEKFKFSIEDNSRLQKENFKINLEVIKQKCDLIKPQKKEEDKKDEEKNIGMILLKVEDSVTEICDRIKVFNQIRNQHKQLHVLFDSQRDNEFEILEQLQNFHKDLKEKMLKLQQKDSGSEQFIINYKILTNLLVLDSFELIDGFKTSFQTIQDEAQAILAWSFNKSEIEGQKALSNHNYRQFDEIIEIENQIQKINNTSSMKVLKIKLDEHLNKLNKDVTDRLRFVEKDEKTVQELNERAININELLQRVKKEYIGDHNVLKLNQTLAKFYASLINNSKTIQDKSQQLIKEKRFFEAFRMIRDSLNVLKQIDLNQKQQEKEDGLDKLIEDAKTKIVELSADYKNLHSQIKEVAKQFQKCSHPRDFAQMSVPLICDGLQQICDANEIDLDVTAEKDAIISSIKLTYIKSFSTLEEIVEKDHIAASFDNKNEIKEIKNSLTYINEQIRKEMSPKIDELEKSINVKIKSISQSLDQILSTDQQPENIDFKKLSDSLFSRKTNLEPENKKRVEKQCLKLVQYLEERLKSGPLTDVFDQLGKYFDIQSEFIAVHVNQQTKQRIEAIGKNIKGIFSELYSIITNQFQSLNFLNKAHVTIQAKSDYLKNDCILKTFNSFFMIPDKFRSQLNSNFQQNITTLTDVGFRSLTDIKSQFQEFINANKYNEAIQIWKLQDNIQRALQCFRDEDYDKFCKKINDQQINEKVEYLKSYSVEFYKNELVSSFKNLQQLAEKSLEQMQVQNNGINFDFQKFKSSIDVLKIFSDHDQLFQELSTKANVEKIQEKLFKIMDEKIDLLSVKQFESFLNKDFNQGDFETLKIVVETLKNMRSFYKQDVIDQKFKEIDKYIRQFGIETCQKIKQIDKILNENKSIADFLIKLQALIYLFDESIKEIKKVFQDYQDQILLKVKNEFQFELEFIQSLQDILKNSNYGQQIIQRNRVFDEISASQQESAQNIADQLDQMIKNSYGENISSQLGSNINIKQISDMFKEFEVKFNKQLKLAFDNQSDKDYFVQNNVDIIKKSVEKENINLINSYLTDLLAKIFCIYSVVRQNGLLNQKTFSQFQQSHFKPQPEQVVALLRMFGIGYLNQSEPFIFNNLVDMNPREENGIVVSVASCIFALHGFQVSCACENEFLTIRENESYYRLFQKLRVQHLIEYNTLHQICKNYLLISDRKQNQTQLTLNQAYEQELYQGDQQQNYQIVEIKKRVLLLYNTQTLFSKKFQSQVYSPSIILNNNKELNVLFKNTKEGVGIFGKIKKFFTGNELELKTFNNKYQELILRAIYKEVNNFNYFDPEQQDQLDDEQGQFKQDDQNISLILYLGKFLLSKIPENFTYIVGLTSHLQINDQDLRKLMGQYKMQQLSIIPSFKTNSKPQNNLLADNKEKVLPTESEQFHEIQLKIDELIKNQKLQILVVFNSQETISRFLKSKQPKSLKYKQLFLTKNGRSLITKAEDLFTVGNLFEKVNLITREDVVSIDFKIQDPNIGLHVIQTFPPNSQTEELNIKAAASNYFKFTSKEDIEQQMQQLDDLIKIKNLVYPEIHSKSIQASSKIYQNQSDFDFQSFLIDVNNLPEKAMEKPIENDVCISFAIMIEFSEITKTHIIDRIFTKLKDIFIQQNAHNHLFKISKDQDQFLSFNIYFLCSKNRDFDKFKINKLDDLEKEYLRYKKEIENKKHLDCLTKSFISALSNVTGKQKILPKFIALLGSQDIDIEEIYNSEGLKSKIKKLPPIFSYNIEGEKQNFSSKYSQLSFLGKSDGKSVGPISSDQFEIMLQDIEYYIFKQIYLLLKDRMAEEDDSKHIKWLNKKERIRSK